MERTVLTVCENIGTLAITLNRTGDLSSVAFVSIEAQDKTTRVNDDYMVSPARQVQFDPGKTHKSSSFPLTLPTLFFCPTTDFFRFLCLYSSSSSSELFFSNHKIIYERNLMVLAFLSEYTDDFIPSFTSQVCRLLLGISRLLMMASKKAART